MNKQMMKQLYEQLVQKALADEDQDEYIIATVHHPITQLICEGARREEIRRHTTQANQVLAAGIGNRIAIQFAYLTANRRHRNYDAIDLINHSTDTKNKFTLVRDSIETIGNVNNIAFDTLPQFAAGNLLDMMEKGESDVTKHLYAYYAIVVTWSKNNVGNRNAVSVNLHQYVQELLSGTNATKKQEKDEKE